MAEPNGTGGAAVVTVPGVGDELDESLVHETSDPDARRVTNTSGRRDPRALLRCCWLHATTRPYCLKWRRCPASRAAVRDGWVSSAGSVVDVADSGLTALRRSNHPSPHDEPHENGHDHCGPGHIDWVIIKRDDENTEPEHSRNSHSHEDWPTSTQRVQPTRRVIRHGVQTPSDTANCGSELWPKWGRLSSHTYRALGPWLRDGSLFSPMYAVPPPQDPRFAWSGVPPGTAVGSMAMRLRPVSRANNEGTANRGNAAGAVAPPGHGTDYRPGRASGDKCDAP